MKRHKVLGLMSGTSLDGLDLAYCHFWKKLDRWYYSIEATETIVYPTEMRQKLESAIILSAAELFMLHNQYGEFLGEASRRFIEEKELTVDLISSHGHTVHHRPQDGITVQIGSGQHLANISGLKTVCDFRSNDVALGGQGAPLVPVGDHLLFGQYDYCLNLGGISNISYERDGKRQAYDIGIANMLLNYLARKTGLEYDQDGELASKGKIDESYLQDLNKLEYYELPPPRSTGYEWFQSEVIPIVEKYELSVENLLHTSVIHICQQVAKSVGDQSDIPTPKLLLTGGGAFNKFLVTQLTEMLDGVAEVVVPSKELIAFKEALIFALMGTLRLEREINILKTVTGATRDSCSGVVYYPS